MTAGNEVMPQNIEEKNARNSKYFSMHFSMKKNCKQQLNESVRLEQFKYMKISTSEEKSTRSNITQVRWPLEM